MYGGVPPGYPHHLRQSADANHQMYLNQARDYRMVPPASQVPINNMSNAFQPSQTAQPSKYQKANLTLTQFFAQQGQKMPTVTVPVKQKSNVIEIIDSD